MRNDYWICTEKFLNFFGSYCAMVKLQLYYTCKLVWIPNWIYKSFQHTKIPAGIMCDIHNGEFQTNWIGYRSRISVILTEIRLLLFDHDKTPKQSWEKLLDSIKFWNSILLVMLWRNKFQRGSALGVIYSNWKETSVFKRRWLEGIVLRNLEGRSPPL